MSDVFRLPQDDPAAAWLQREADELVGRVVNAKPEYVRQHPTSFIANVAAMSTAAVYVLIQSMIRLPDTEAPLPSEEEFMRDLDALMIIYKNIALETYKNREAIRNYYLDTDKKERPLQ